MPERDPDASAGETPLDAADPRFTDAPRPSSAGARRLVPATLPGARREQPVERLFRRVLPVVFAAAVLAVVAVFSAGLRPAAQVTVVGPEPAVRAEVGHRPHRVCLRGNNPCAWLALVGDRLVAFNTSGPLPQEYGRAGVGWCPSSGYYGANATGSRFDPTGQVARGPATRGLDRFRVFTDERGRVVVDWRDLSAGLRAFQVEDLVPPRGPHCETVPFDPAADLELD